MLFYLSLVVNGAIATTAQFTSEDLLLEAIENFEKAIQVLLNELESLYELARFYDNQGDTERAEDYYRRVVEADRFSALGRLSLKRLDELKSKSSR